MVRDALPALVAEVEVAGVRVTQDCWEALGADAATWRDRNTAGWGGVLPHFVVACDAP